MPNSVQNKRKIIKKIYNKFVKKIKNKFFNKRKNIY
jgi:hypothetical protein